MPELSEEGEQVLKAKVSWAADVETVVTAYSQSLVILPVDLSAGPALLCSRGCRPACALPVYLL